MAQRIAELSDFINCLGYQDLPSAVVSKVKEIMLNSWGVQLAASTAEWCRIAYRFGRRQGGPPESTVVNYGDRLSALNTVFVNATFAHGLELDDAHFATGIKGGCVTVPTALAVGEVARSTGEQVVLAVAAGYEVMLRMGLAARDGIYSRGHQATASCGAIGAAGVVAKLLGLGLPRTCHALAAAASQMVGLSEVPSDGRGDLKRTFGGMAAFAGTRAALLAEAGLTSPWTTLETDFGVCRSYGVGEAAARQITEGLGERWEILRAQIKPYAQDGYIQPMTEGLERLTGTHSFATDEIERVWLGTNKHARDNVVGTIRRPQTITDAQFSANFSAALYLVKGGAGFADYSAANLHDPEILDLSKRVVVDVDDEIERSYGEQHQRGAKVVVTLKSGKEYSTKIDNVRAITPIELAARFMALSQTALAADRSAQLLSAVHNLQQIQDVSWLALMLVRAAPRTSIPGSISTPAPLQGHRPSTYDI